MIWEQINFVITNSTGTSMEHFLSTQWNPHWLNKDLRFLLVSHSGIAVASLPYFLVPSSVHDILVTLPRCDKMPDSNNFSKERVIWAHDLGGISVHHCGNGIVTEKFYPWLQEGVARATCMAMSQAQKELDIKGIAFTQPSRPTLIYLLPQAPLPKEPTTPFSSATGRIPSVQT